jgi:hypothetical protein
MDYLRTLSDVTSAWLLADCGLSVPGSQRSVLLSDQDFMVNIPAAVVCCVRSKRRVLGGALVHRRGWNSRLDWIIRRRALAFT